MDTYNVIKTPGEGEYTEKKSRFIGHAMSIGSEAEAMAVIEQIKRKYWDARHNCYAYVTGERGEISRYSDDGEPGGTAGRPILEVISGAGLRDTLIVVTRYFGGTLLGTGGLVRAYTAASKEALSNAVICSMAPASRIHINMDYTLVGKIQYYLSQAGISIDESTYGAEVDMVITVRAEDVDRVCGDITEAAGGKCAIDILESGYYQI